MQAAAPPTAPIVGSGDHHDDHPTGEDADITVAPPPGFVIDPALATSLGLDEETRRGLLGSFGFRSVGEPAQQRWRWSGLRKPDKRQRRKPPRKGTDPTPRTAANGDIQRRPIHTAKDKHSVPRVDKPRADPPRPPRADRPARRSPSPNSPFAGLAALLADARKD